MFRAPQVLGICLSPLLYQSCVSTSSRGLEGGLRSLQESLLQIRSVRNLKELLHLGFLISDY